jgi:excisionase family DNA binding protein
MTSILKILSRYPDMNITVKANDLKEAIDYCVARTRDELEQHIIDERTETYPSPEQVCKMLNVTRPTLWRWHKKGYLTHIEVGGERRYRMSDVKSILKGGKENETTK